ncbi:MAG: single-stranded DNA-binding protein [Saprospiraceae bacterium]
MAINNTVKLIGNMGSEVKVIESDGTKFAAVSIATTDSYKDKGTEEWTDKATIWHSVVAFNSKVIEQLKSFKKGTRLEITGSLSYREFKLLDQGKEITKREASIIAHKVEQAPLVKKTPEAA